MNNKYYPIFSESLSDILMDMLTIKLYYFFTVNTCLLIINMRCNYNEPEFD